MSFTLIISGINAIIESIEKNPADEAAIIAAMPSSAVWIMKISMMILPLICILVGFVLYQKKFKIDEELYATIVSDLEKRNAQSASVEESKTEKV